MRDITPGIENLGDNAAWLQAAKERTPEERAELRSEWLRNRNDTNEPLVISVAKDIAEKLQIFLEARFGVRVPIVLTAEYRNGFTTSTIWVQRTAIADPDGGTDVTEELSLQEFVRPDNKESLKLRFGYHQVGPSSAIDQWEVQISGADEADRHVLYDLFDARTWKQATGWGGWGTRLVPTFEYNGVRWQYT